ncbi:hypothetical protein GCM10011587_24160 [Pyruvatibacter mobilis]|nr:hypothetical protein GCM10011587_24160 [Pyruvatibacter mobilis]
MQARSLSARRLTIRVLLVRFPHRAPCDPRQNPDPHPHEPAEPGKSFCWLLRIRWGAHRRCAIPYVRPSPNGRTAPDCQAVPAYSPKHADNNYSVIWQGWGSNRSTPWLVVALLHRGA